MKTPETMGWKLLEPQDEGWKLLKTGDGSQMEGTGGARLGNILFLFFPNSPGILFRAELTQQSSKFQLWQCWREEQGLELSQVPGPRFAPLPEGSRKIQRDPEGFKRIQRNPEISKGIQSDPEGSRDIQRYPEGSERFQRDSKGSRGVQRYPEGSRGIQKGSRGIQRDSITETSPDTAAPPCITGWKISDPKESQNFSSQPSPQGIENLSFPWNHRIFPASSHPKGWKI